MPHLCQLYRALIPNDDCLQAPQYLPKIALQQNFCLFVILATMAIAVGADSHSAGL